MWMVPLRLVAGSRKTIQYRSGRVPTSYLVAVGGAAPPGMPSLDGRARPYGVVHRGRNRELAVERLTALYTTVLTATMRCLGSLRCDCGEQLELAMRAIARERCGLLIYEHQEGRGIGLTAKLQAYGLQDGGLDTVEANHALGFETDYRDFGLPIAILRDLGIGQVHNRMKRA